MKKRLTLIILIIFVVCVGVLSYLAYFGRFDSLRIKGVLNGAKRAVEHEDIDGLMSYVSTRYNDGYGFDYPMVKRFISGLFKDFDKFQVKMENPVVRIKDDTAIAQFSLWVLVDWNGRQAYIVGTNRRGAAVRAYLRKGLLSWKVVKIEGVR